jgi:hypothetical protein
VERGQLRTMGFTNDNLSIKALKKAGGVVEKAHAALAAFSAHKADALTAKAAKQQQRLIKLQVGAPSVRSSPSNRKSPRALFSPSTVCLAMRSAAITVFISHGDTMGHRDRELVAPSQQAAARVPCHCRLGMSSAMRWHVWSSLNILW